MCASNVLPPPLKVTASAYFLQSDKVMIQPHMGGITDKAWQKAYREALENMRSFFATGKAISPINAEPVSS